MSYSQTQTMLIIIAVCQDLEKIFLKGMIVSEAKAKNRWWQILFTFFILCYKDCDDDVDNNYDGDDDDDDDGYPAYSHHDKIPPWWEYVSNDKGGNVSVSKSHHTW